jgi:hypothetical protein
MSAVFMSSRASGGKWFVAVLLAVVAIALAAWQMGRDAPDDARMGPAVAAVPAPQAPALMVPGLDTTRVAAQQVAAAGAAARAVGVKPASGHIAERPDFVSAVEWLVLQGVARKSADSDMELTHLVNNLRFSKQLELWRSLAGSADTAQRHAIAGQLLNDIPDRVRGNDLDLAGAQQLQADLLADLFSDPQERMRQAAQEAKRIGVVVDIEESAGVAGSAGE